MTDGLKEQSLTPISGLVFLQDTWQNPNEEPDTFWSSVTCL